MAINFNKARRLKHFSLFMLLVCFCIQGLAWNSNIHRIIAQITYHHLNQAAIKRANFLLFNEGRLTQKDNPFIAASTWADDIKRQDVHAYDRWHFINQAIAEGAMKTPPVNQDNIVFALEQSQQVLNSFKSPINQKRQFLKFMIHLMGDIHQPLHCATLYSKAFLQGDQGGNRFLLKDSSAQNLHALWDQGLGLLSYYGYDEKVLDEEEVEKIAFKLEKKYPKSFFKDRLFELSPEAIANESYHIALKSVYLLKPGVKPSESYIQKSQDIAAQQIVLAGYRLANMLNNANSHI